MSATRGRQAVCNLIVRALDAADRLSVLAERLNDGPNSPDLTSAIEDYRRFSRQLDVAAIERK